MKLVLVRGIPGSGKSTWAKAQAKAYPNATHREADMFFEASGEYQFDPTLLGYAHEWCYSNTVFDLLSGKDVFVSNTFTKNWEMEKYIAIGVRLGCEITVVEMKTNYGSIHDVPEAKIQQMKERWENVSDEFKNFVEIYEVK